MSILAAKRTLVRDWIPIILVFALAGIAAKLIVAERWPMLAGILLGAPAFVFLRRYPFMGLLVWLMLDPFLMLTPTSNGRMVFWAIHRALPPLSLCMVIFNEYILRNDQRRRPQLGIPELAMFGYVITTVVSIFLLNDSPRATLYLFYDRVFSPMCLYLLVRLSAPNERDLWRMIPILFFICVSQSVIGIFFWTSPDVLPSAWLNRIDSRATGSLLSPSVYTITLIFSGLLVFHAALNRKHGAMRMLYFGGFALSLIGIFLSYSRACWLTGLAMVIGMMSLYPKAIARLAVVGCALVFLGSGVLAGHAHYAYKRLHSRQTALSRLPVAFASLKMLQIKPVFGWGYENFNRYDWEFQERVANYAPTKDHSSHNVYLTILAEQGLMGLTLYLIPCVWWVVSSIRAVPRLSEKGFWSRQLLYIFWLIILSHILVNNLSNMRVVFGLGLWWVTLGFVAAICQSNLQAGDDAIRVRRTLIGPDTST